MTPQTTRIRSPTVKAKRTGCARTTGAGAGWRRRGGSPCRAVEARARGSAGVRGRRSARGTRRSSRSWRGASRAPTSAGRRGRRRRRRATSGRRRTWAARASLRHSRWRATLRSSNAGLRTGADSRLIGPMRVQSGRALSQRRQGAFTPRSFGLSVQLGPRSAPYPISVAATDAMTYSQPRDPDCHDGTHGVSVFPACRVLHGLRPNLEQPCHGRRPAADRCMPALRR